MHEPMKSDAFLYLIDSIYQSVGNSHGWGTVLADIRVAVSAVSVILSITSNEDEKGCRVVADPTRLSRQDKLEVAILVRSLTEHMHPGSVSVIDGNIPEAKLLSERFCRDGLILVAVVAKDDGRKFSIISVIPGATSGHREFAHHLFKMITPHLQTAFALRRDITLRSEKVAHLERLLSVSGIPKAMVNADLRLCEYNEAFEKLATDLNSPITIDADYLQITEEKMSQGVERMLTQASARSVHANVIWIKDTGFSRGWFVKADAVAVKMNSVDHLVSLSGGREAKFVLSFYRVGEPSSLTASLIATVLSLTPAEARLTLDLSNGFAPAEIAHSRGVSKNTVHNQLTSVMARHGLHRQSQLVSLLSALCFFVG